MKNFPPVPNYEVPKNSLGILTFVRNAGVPIAETVRRTLPFALLKKYQTNNPVEALVAHFSGDVEATLDAKFRRICDEYPTCALPKDIEKLTKIFGLFIEKILTPTRVVREKDFTQQEKTKKPKNADGIEYDLDEHIQKLYESLNPRVHRWHDHFERIIKDAHEYLDVLFLRYKDPHIPSYQDEEAEEDNEEWKIDDKEIIERKYLDLVFALLLAMETWIKNFSERATQVVLKSDKSTLDTILTFCHEIQEAYWDIFGSYPYDRPIEIKPLASDISNFINGTLDKIKHSPLGAKKIAKIRAKKSAKKSKKKKPNADGEK